MDICNGYLEKKYSVGHFGVRQWKYQIVNVLTIITRIYEVTLILQWYTFGRVRYAADTLSILPSIVVGRENPRY